MDKFIGVAARSKDCKKICMLFYPKKHKDLFEWYPEVNHDWDFGFIDSKGCFVSKISIKIKCD